MDTATSANSVSPGLFARAADLVIRERCASPDLLLRVFHLDLQDALLLLMQLAGAGIIEEPNPAGRYHVAQSRLSTRLDVAPPKVVHIRIVCDLAQYLLETHQRENTDCVSLLVDSFSYHRDELRLVVGNALAKNLTDPLFEVAMAICNLPQMAERYKPSDIQEDVQRCCAGLQRNSVANRDNETLRFNGLYYAMRYLERRIMQGIDPHSRAVDLFIHRDVLPQGKALNIISGHGEHVVPCDFVQQKAMALLRCGIPAHEVAEWIEPFVRVVWIDKAAASQLDGPERLKVVMPEGWQFGRDCIYARLHHLHIPFTPPEEGPGCGCGLVEVSQAVRTS